MTVKISRKNVVGDSSGKVMLRNSVQPLAPSTFAASYSSVGHVAETGEEDGDIVADEDPGGERDQRHQRQARALEPEWDAEAETTAPISRNTPRGSVNQCWAGRPTSRKARVQQAVVRAVQIAPDRRRGDGRGDVRQEEQHPEDLLAAHLLVEQIGDPQTQPELERHRDQRVRGRHQQRMPQRRIGQGSGVVVEADELGALQPPVAGADVRAIQDREDVEDQQQERRGREQRVAEADLGKAPAR